MNQKEEGQKPSRLPIGSDAEELESYRRFLLTLAALIGVSNPLFFEVAHALDRVEEYVCELSHSLDDIAR